MKTIQQTGAPPAKTLEATPDPNEKLYDLAIIHDISGGDEEFVKTMVVLFIDTVPPNIAELRAYTNAGNWDMVSKMAHKLKSTLDSMGINSLKHAVRTVEETAKNMVALENIPALVHTISTVITVCIKQLETDIL